MLRIRIYFKFLTVLIFNTCTTCWYVNLSKNFRFLFDCGCKGKDFFLTSKFFDEKFSSFFSQADLRAVGNYRLAQPTSSPTQGYLHVFIISEAPFSLECGCKSSVIKHNLQTFPVLFFKFFSRGGSRTLIIRRYPFSAHMAHHVASRVTTCT